MMVDLPHAKADGAGDSLGVAVRKIFRWTWLVALVTLIGLLGALLVSKSHARVYRATGQVQLNSISDASVISGSSNATAPSSTNYVQEYSLLTSAQVASTVAHRLRLASPPTASFSQGVTNTQQVTITADASAPAAAASIVSAYASAYVAASQAISQQQLAAAVSSLSTVINNETTRLNALEAKSAALKPKPSAAADAPNRYTTEIGVLQAQQQFYLQRLAQAQFGQVPGQGNDAAVLVAAVADTSPISPKTSRDTILGGVIGFLIGLAAAMVMVGRDDRLRDVRSIVGPAAGLPILASIPRRKMPRWGAQPVGDEAYRTLRSAISFGTGGRTERLQVVGIGESSTHARVAAGLAMATARTGRRTVLLCADVRSPILPEALGLQSAPGLTSVLAGDLLPSTVQQDVTDESDLVFIGPGPIDDASPELFARSAARDIVKLLTEHGEMLIVNAAPLPGATDAAILATMVDCNVIVVELGRTRADDLAAAVAMLNRAEAPLLGVVVH